MARHAHEFQCTECGYFNYPKLDETMHGNYTVVCGKCRHHHYRVIEDGVVTEDRHNAKYDNAVVIHLTESATSKERRQLGAVAQFRQLVAAGLAK